MRWRGHLATAVTLVTVVALAAPISAGNALAFADTGLQDAELELARERGRISGQAEHCGLDWERLNFRPMMAYWRRNGKNGKQTAVLAAMHGIGQGSAKKLACTPQNIRIIKSKLKFKG